MAGYAAIAEASETLVELLRDRIAERGDVVAIDRTEIALVSPADVGADSDVRLSVFLYDVTENEILKNEQRTVVDETRTREPPLALDLRYLITAFPSQSGSDETANTLDQQRVLGLAMQVLREHALLGPDELPSSLAGNEIQVAREDESLQAITDIWSTFGDTGLQPSVTYELSPVLIDATTEQAVERVTGKGMEYNQPGGEE
ncbi:MAG: DUF4255 domain-containing protein [Haloarculaceae archaeon]